MLFLRVRNVMATRKCHAASGHPPRVASGFRSETGERDVVRLFLQADALHGNFCGDELERHDLTEPWMTRRGC